VRVSVARCRHRARLRARASLAESICARDLGQRPLPGHAIAGWGFKTSIVMLLVAMLKARATSNISFAMKSLLSQKAIPN
jgi:hypothetical protein